MENRVGFDGIDLTYLNLLIEEIIAPETFE